MLPILRGDFGEPLRWDVTFSCRILGPKFALYCQTLRCRATDDDLFQVRWIDHIVLFRLRLHIQQLPSPERQTQLPDVGSPITPTGKAGPGTHNMGNPSPSLTSMSPKSHKAREVSQFISSHDLVDSPDRGNDLLPGAASRLHSIRASQRDATWVQYLSYIVFR